MKRALWILLSLSLAAAACGFGLADDSGKPIPGPNYWGWQCEDGGIATDAGCPPPDEDGGD